MASGFHDFGTLSETFIDFFGFERLLYFVVLSLNLIRESIIGCYYGLIFSRFNSFSSRLMLSIDCFASNIDFLRFASSVCSVGSYLLLS